MKRAVYIIWLVMVVFFLSSCTGTPPEQTDPATEPKEGEAVKEATAEASENKNPAGETVEKTKEEAAVEKVEGEEPVIEGRESDALTIDGSIAGYKIKPGDILNIDCGRFKDASMQQARVDDKGFIKMPFINRVKVAGLTKWEVEDLLEEKFKPFFKNLKAIVEVTNLKYTIGGEVKGPGQKGIIADVRLTEAIDVAGGPTSWANMKAVTIRRKNKEGKPVILKFNCDRIKNGDDEDPFIIPDDIINVPR
jgi:protein involved in polysaccharide export with SLBB domain